MPLQGAIRRRDRRSVHCKSEYIPKTLKAKSREKSILLHMIGRIIKNNGVLTGERKHPTLQGLIGYFFFSEQLVRKNQQKRHIT